MFEYINSDPMLVDPLTKDLPPKIFDGYVVQDGLVGVFSFNIDFINSNEP